mmetsp:Transcript_9218/g.24127  ORF Transcript_9218/g.24127 Transcript_9218/m.24127 type:complete len:363 (+) Transcript_9218:1138-2226(+)
MQPQLDGGRRTRVLSRTDVPRVYLGALGAAGRTLAAAHAAAGHATHLDAAPLIIAGESPWRRRGRLPVSHLDLVKGVGGSLGRAHRPRRHAAPVGVQPCEPLPLGKHRVSRRARRRARDIRPTATTILVAAAATADRECRFGGHLQVATRKRREVRAEEVAGELNIGRLGLLDGMLRHEHTQHKATRRLPRPVHAPLHLLEMVGPRRPAHDRVGIALHVEPLAVSLAVGDEWAVASRRTLECPLTRAWHRREQGARFGICVGEEQGAVPCAAQPVGLRGEGVRHPPRALVVRAHLRLEGLAKDEGVGIARVEARALPACNLRAVGRKALGGERHGHKLEAPRSLRQRNLTDDVLVQEGGQIG